MKNNYVIYAYEFPEHVYIGLTNNMQQRDYQHRNSEDSINTFCKNNKLKMPSPKILEYDLSLTEAKLKEKDWLDLYISKGFQKINVMKCGVALFTDDMSVEKNVLLVTKRPSKISETERKIREGTLTKDEATGMFYRYATKTQMCKQFPALYEVCKKNGWLALFPKRKKTNAGRATIKKEPKLLHYEDIPKTAFFFNEKDHYYATVPENGDLYVIHKKNVIKLIPTELNGLIYYTYMKRWETIMTPYHCILAKALGIKDGYIVEYKDGNTHNISKNNIQFIETDYSKSKQIFDSECVVFNDGTLIERKTKMAPLALKKEKNGVFYKGINVDKIVFNYFNYPIDFLEDEILHKNGDVFDNSAKNLECRTSLPRKRNTRALDMVEIESEEGVFKIYINDNAEKMFIAKTSDNIAATDIREALITKLRLNIYWKQWIKNFKEFEIPEYIENVRKRRNDIIRCESSGCYWHASRNCWKSKIYYIDKEYSLGYFKTFEEGKMLYEEAAAAIKFNVFENWYKTIENRREDIKRIFKH